MRYGEKDTEKEEVLEDCQVHYDFSVCLAPTPSPRRILGDIPDIVVKCPGYRVIDMSSRTGPDFN